MEQRLDELQSLRDRGMISEEEYSAARRSALGITTSPAPPPPPVATTVGTVVENGPQEGGVAAPPVVRCTEGHLMQFVDSIVVTNQGEGVSFSREFEPMCVSCFVKIPRSDGGFFVCQSCPSSMNSINTWRHVCKSCALSNQHMRFGRENDPAASCTQCGPYCLDSFLCFYCLMGEMALFFGGATNAGCCPTRKGLPEDGTDMTFDCSACCCALTLASLDLMGLGFMSNLWVMDWYGRVMRWFSMKEEHQLYENQCSLCWLTMLCRCCVLAQIGNEMAARGVYPGGICCTRRPSNCHPRAPRPEPPMLNVEPLGVSAMNPQNMMMSAAQIQPVQSLSPAVGAPYPSPAAQTSPPPATGASGVYGSSSYAAPPPETNHPNWVGPVKR